MTAKIESMKHRNVIMSKARNALKNFQLNSWRLIGLGALIYIVLWSAALIAWFIPTSANETVLGLLFTAAGIPVLVVCGFFFIICLER